MSRAITAVLIGFCALVSTGCGGAANIDSWQRGVERYVAQTGGGNPAVLRDVKLPDGRRGFSVLGQPDSRQSTDANAVLLGYQPINGTPRFVYLVGVVDKNVVEDMRLATLAVYNGKYEWNVGEKNEEALKTYRTYADQRWRERFPDRKSPPVEYTSFPQFADQFEMNVADKVVSATHRASGARWELEL